MTSANSHRPPWRVEDEPLLRGRGRFIDDAPLPGQVYGCFLLTFSVGAAQAARETSPRATCVTH